MGSSAVGKADSHSLNSTSDDSSQSASIFAGLAIFSVASNESGEGCSLSCGGALGLDLGLGLGFDF